MASILPFVRNKFDFDDEATRLMGEAFDAACKGLRDTGQPAVVREIIAKRIIAAAKKGERDAARLRSAGLAALGYDRKRFRRDGVRQFKVSSASCERSSHTSAAKFTRAKTNGP